MLLPTLLLALLLSLAHAQCQITTALVQENDIKDGYTVNIETDASYATTFQQVDATAGVSGGSLAIALNSEGDAQQLTSLDLIDKTLTITIFAPSAEGNVDFNGASTLHGMTSALVLGVASMFALGKVSKLQGLALLAVLFLTHVCVMSACSPSAVLVGTLPAGYTCDKSDLNNIKCVPPPPVCTCVNGAGAVGADCTSDGPKCGSCDAGFSLDGTSCAKNTCTCENGAEATDAACTSNGPLCVSCFTTFRLAGTACEATACTCNNGVAASGADCAVDAPKCASCSDGFALSGSDCTGIACTGGGVDTTSTAGACTCKAGFSGPVTYTGGLAGGCTANDCLETSLANSNRADSIKGSTLQEVPVTCDTGFTQSGGDFATCGTDGVFTLPTCTPKDCNAKRVPNSEYANKDLTGKTGDKVAVLCDAGFGGSGDAECQGDGEFSTITCSPDGCAATSVDNSDFSTSGSIKGVTNEFEDVVCDDGYAGGGRTTCSSSGTFAPALTCTGKDCAALTVANSNKATNGVTGSTGQTDSVTCNTGYSGGGSTTCTANGAGTPLWTPVSCSPNPCATAFSTAQGTTGGAGTAHGGVYQFDCAVGHVASGGATCTLGNWDSPTCVAISCDFPGYTGTAGQCKCDTANAYTGSVFYDGGEPAGCSGISCAKTGYYGNPGDCYCAKGYAGTPTYTNGVLGGCTGISCELKGYTGTAGACTCASGWSGTVKYDSTTNKPTGCEEDVIPCTDPVCNTLCGIANSGYRSTVSYTKFCTVDPAATHIAIGIWAGEREDHDIQVEPTQNFEFKWLTATTCSRSHAPWTSIVEGQCAVFSTASSFKWDARGISECKLTFDAATRDVKFTDTSGSEDCAYAVYQNVYGAPCTETGYVGMKGACRCATGYTGTVVYQGDTPTGCAPISCAKTGYTGTDGACTCASGYTGTVTYTKTAPMGCLGQCNGSVCLTLVGVGDTTYSYSRSNVWKLIGTVPDNAAYIAIGVWAGENYAIDLATSTPKWSMTMTSVTACTRSDAPWASNVEGECQVFTTKDDFNFIAYGISECKLRYSATTRKVEMEDHSSSEDCAYAVMAAGL